MVQEHRGESERVNSFETVSSIVQCSFTASFVGGRVSGLVSLWISAFRIGVGKLTTDAGSGLIDTMSGGALALGAPLTKRSG